ncbi:nucleoside diphosphate kinase regulator [Dongia deserti]|uniref:nucleoside diphosphate kinase regulator n=1 Tax=Dongia deserti TaxID=2268030 RepID=UPI000E64D0F9|nr:nucleoside diphosphate kinase regulator [Dongia deserti]
MEKQSQNGGDYRLPEIVVSDTDHARLTSLATAALETVPDTAEELLSELDRAKVVADESVPPDVVRMGSAVEFSSDQDRKRVTLVFPQEADIAAGKVSVLTPVGAALIGLAEGESITWTARDGSSHEMTIVSVEQPEQSAAK